MTVAQKVALEQRHLRKLRLELRDAGEHDLERAVERAARELENAHPDLSKHPEVKL